MASVILSGKVKFFNEIKGFGFIKDAKKDTDYFFHVSGVIDKVKKDDLVEFELQEGKRGIKAINIQKTEQ